MIFIPMIDREHHDGRQQVYLFENRRGASVVRFPGSHGSEAGLFELGELKCEPDADPRERRNYPLADPLVVIGWLDAEAVQEHLAAIASLPNA